VIPIVEKIQEGKLLSAVKDSFKKNIVSKFYGKAGQMRKESLESISLIFCWMRTVWNDNMAGFSESHKKAVYDAEFPAALGLAYRVGAVR